MSNIYDVLYIFYIMYMNYKTIDDFKSVAGTMVSIFCLTNRTIREAHTVSVLLFTVQTVSIKEIQAIKQFI